ncbi:MAG: histidine kinase [Eubacteriales bacterium]|nr:histidine kinase [Eubacteriales bacterium]
MDNAGSNLETMCSSVKNSVEQQLDNISTISMNIVYSNAIKSNFREFSDNYSADSANTSSLATSRQKMMAIADIVTAMIGAYQSASEIKLYTMDGCCAEVGFWQRISTVDLESLPWYEETVALHGYKYIGNPTLNTELPAQGGKKNLQKFISLTRTFGDDLNQPEGIVEVIQDCDKIFSLPIQLEQQNPDSSIYIYNSRHEQVYPYSESAGDLATQNYDELVRGQELKEGDTHVLTDSVDEPLLVTWLPLDDYDWSVIIARPRAAVYESLKSYRSAFTVIAALSILLTLAVCMYISQRMTVPLLKLTKATGKITINRVLDEKKVNLTSADSNIRELSMLCESIRSMYEKLRSTSQEVLLSRSEETRAKLQATQSLINPHFLYNCLTSMGIMAEEGMNDDIMKMCYALCDYFRYISSSREMIVTLSEEIFYTRQYLECMKLRFNEELNIVIEVPDEAQSIYIPKLITQPIVENAFKYAFQIKPPWKLSISVQLQDNTWNLVIRDNGGKMTDEKKEELMRLYENLDMNEELKSMQIGGMGLKNVYLRLALLYGERAIFRIDNSEPGSTAFVLGGPIYLTREEYYAEHPHL